jgi:hypothetical protein
MFLGTYDRYIPISDTNKHVDSAAMTNKLVEGHMNFYNYLIKYGPDDWGDLLGFLAEAKSKNISVIVTVVPEKFKPSCSQPFCYDFDKWGEELAKLSLNYPNLIGYSIEDWYKLDGINAGRNKARVVNPNFKFYPTVYVQCKGDPIDVDGVILYPEQYRNSGFYPDASEWNNAINSCKNLFPGDIIVGVYAAEYFNATADVVRAKVQLARDANPRGVMTFALQWSGPIWDSVTALYKQWTPAYSTTTTLPRKCEFSSFQDMASDITGADWSTDDLRDNYGRPMHTIKIVYSPEKDSYLAVYHFDVEKNQFETWLAESKDLKNWNEVRMLSEKSSSQPYILTVKGSYYVAVEKDTGDQSYIIVMRYPDTNSLYSGQPDKQTIIPRGRFSYGTAYYNKNEGTANMIDTDKGILLGHHWNDLRVERDRQATGYVDYELNGIKNRKTVKIVPEDLITGDIGDRDMVNLNGELMIVIEGNNMRREPGFEKYWRIYAGYVDTTDEEVDLYKLAKLDIRNNWGETAFANPSISLVPSPTNKNNLALVFSYLGVTKSGQVLFYHEIEGCEYERYCNNYNNQCQFYDFETSQHKTSPLEYINDIIQGIYEYFKTLTTKK